MVELFKILQRNGMDVWVCSSSGIDITRAAIDAFGLHDYVTGVLGMTVKLDGNNEYINSYDYETGRAWMINEKGNWEKNKKTNIGTVTISEGKVEAINNVIYPIYGVGPLASSISSNLGFHMATEYENLKLVVVINRGCSVRDLSRCSVNCSIQSVLASVE